MHEKEQLDKVLASVALLFSDHELIYAGGIQTSDWIIEDNLKRSPEEFVKTNHFTMEKAIEFKSQLEFLNNLMQDFPILLQHFVSSPIFEEEWSKMLPNEINDLVLMHKDSYRILREKKSPYELIYIDKQDILNELDDYCHMTDYVQIRDVFNLPEVFSAKPEDKLQLLEQLNFLVDIGYDTSVLNGSFDKGNYTKKLVKMLYYKHSEGPMENFLQLTKDLGQSLPWYIQHQLSFIEDNENQLQKNTHKFAIK
jgi:hypothetical protein